ncbi:MAG: signal peptidase II [Dehalococcoidia bacterium]
MTSSPSTTVAVPETRTRRVLHRLRAFLVVAALVVVADQWTKSLVRARLDLGEQWPEGWWLIHLTHTQNTGAAFGVLQGAGGALTIVGFGAIAGITFVLLTLPARNRLYTIALSAILGGAIGNLIDRLRLGAVTDFIEPTHYPAFNIADSAIVVGVCTLLALTWFEREPADAPEAAS